MASDPQLELVTANAAWRAEVAHLDDVFAVYARVESWDRPRLSRYVELLAESLRSMHAAALESERARLELKLQLIEVEQASRRLQHARAAVKAEAKAAGGDHTCD